MRRDKVGKIVTIGNGLCRVIVRSEKLARRLAEIPGVEVRDDDSEHLGWWIVFPMDLRPVIEPVFRGTDRTIVTRQPTQLSLFDVLPTDGADGSADETTSPQEGAGGGADTSR